MHSHISLAEAPVCPEAAAAATPVIATRSGGAPEAVLHGDTGLVVDRDNVGALADAVRRVGTDEALRGALARASAARAGAFGWPRVTKQYIDAYAAAVRVRQPAPAVAAAG